MAPFVMPRELAMVRSNVACMQRLCDFVFSPAERTQCNASTTDRELLCCCVMFPAFCADCPDYRTCWGKLVCARSFGRVPTVRSTSATALTSLLLFTAATVTKLAGSISAADLAYQDEDGNAALHWAAHFGRVDILETLLDAGASLDQRNVAGNTPLHVACWEGRSGVVTTLLARGASPAVCNDEGYMPLHDAATQGHTDIIQQLLRAGAPLDAESQEGETPLDVAEGDIAKKLLEAYKAPPQVRDTPRRGTSTGRPAFWKKGAGSKVSLPPSS
eukprot:m.38147 g.38147  ORF g.38147 m.38147 type:complete len:274 (+) comp11153_c0_seq2:138-959(+)